MDFSELPNLIFAFGVAIILGVVFTMVIIGLQNSSLTTLTLASGDVVVVHAVGSNTIYNAVVPGNQYSDGNALIAALANAVSKDKFYLAPETFDLSGRNITMIANTAILGWGKFKTVIQSSNSINLVTPASNTVIADLSLIELHTGTVPVYGNSGEPYFTNAIIRNVFFSGDLDGIFINAGTGNPEVVSMYNLTGRTNWDVINFQANNQLSVFNVIDSNLLSSTKTNAFSRAVANSGGTVNLVNDFMSANTSTSSGGFGAAVDVGEFAFAEYGVVNMYGGTAIGLQKANALNASDVFGSGLPMVINVNTTAVYNALNSVGNIVNIGNTGFGSYSYPKGPSQLPTYNIFNVSRAAIVANPGLLGMAAIFAQFPLLGTVIILLAILALAILFYSKGKLDAHQASL